MKAWWDQEVKQAIKVRKEACRAHRKARKCCGQQPNEAKEREVQELWAPYQEKKKIAKELVSRKRREETQVLLEEFAGKTCYSNAKFWQKAK